MQHPQYYKTIPVSEKPEKDGWYHVLNPNGEILGNQKYFHEGWYNPSKANFTHYLQPIEVPEGERLREKMKEIVTKYEGYINNLEGYYQQEETDEPLYSGKQQLHCRIVDHRGFVSDLREALQTTKP